MRTVINEAMCQCASHMKVISVRIVPRKPFHVPRNSPKNTACYFQFPSIFISRRSFPSLCGCRCCRHPITSVPIDFIVSFEIFPEAFMVTQCLRILDLRIHEDNCHQNVLNVSHFIRRKLDLFPVRTSIFCPQIWIDA